MALNFVKGSRFNFAKEAPSLKVAGIGIGWISKKEDDGPEFDLDASAFLLSENGKIPADDYVVFYASSLKTDTPEGMRPYSGDGSVLGTIDAIDGTESGVDDEDMIVLFNNVWEGVNQIVITLSITKYPNDSKKDRRTLSLNFGMIQDLYIRIWDYEFGSELFRYNLKNQFTTEDAIELGRFVRIGNSWEFIATGEGYNGSLVKLIELYT